jgi:hypothetical protein
MSKLAPHYIVPLSAIVLSAAGLAGACADATDLPPPSKPPSVDAAADVRVTTDATSGLRNDFAMPIMDTVVPPNAQAIFLESDVQNANASICVFEPEFGSLFPSNWLRPRFSFTTPKAQNVFEITLTVAKQASPLKIYTGRSGYALDKAAWAIIAGSGAGTVRIKIRSAVLDENNKLKDGPWTSAEGNIEIAPVEAAGSIVYWTSSNGTVMKGFKIGDDSVRTILDPPAADGKCIGCHTSTPDGLYASFSRSDDPGNGSASNIGIRSVDGTAKEPPFLSRSAKTLLGRPNQQAPTFAKAHWSDGDHTLVSMFERGGKNEIAWTDLEATDPAEGKGWGIFARTGDNNSASAAAFSHDGTRVVYTSAANVFSGNIAQSGQLKTIPYNDRKGGPAAAVTGASDPNFIYSYPGFSADDKWLTFNRVPTGDQSTDPPQPHTSYNDVDAEVFVVPSEGGMPTRIAANDPAACLKKKSPGVTNSWPKWSPEVSVAGTKQYYFLVFSSTRNPTSKGPQLYAAPIMIENGVVKSYPALYLWNQPENENNHTPAWDVFKLGPN